MAYMASRGMLQVYDITQSPAAYVSIPLSRIAYENYTITPDQMIDLDSYTAETGKLVRHVLSHTRSKIEFNTPYITSTQWNAVLNVIKSGYKDASERSLRLRYYDPETDAYKVGKFYRPDIEYTVRNVDNTTGVINYDGIRVAFIEY